MSEKKNSKEGITEVIKKVASIGIGAAFMTEDAVRNILSDLPLPKDIVNGLVQNAKGAKKEFTDGMRREMREYLAKMDVTRIIENTLDNYDFEVNAKVSLKKKEKSEDES